MSSDAIRRNDIDAAKVAATAVVAGVNVVLKAGKKWNRWVKTGVIVASALSGVSATVITALSAFVAYKVVSPARRILADDAEAVATGSAVLPREKVTFKSADNRLNLVGNFYPTDQSRAVLILCHGFHGGAIDTHQGAMYAQAVGYNVLTFDFRGCGASEGKTTSVGFWEVEDLLGAIEYVKSRPEVDPQRIGVYGYSMGGAVTMMASARSQDIKAIVTDCAFASLDSLLTVNFCYFYRLPHFPFRHTAVWWSRRFSNSAGCRVEPVEALKKLSEDKRRLPHFIIHGYKDLGIPVTDAHLLYDNSPGPKQLWIAPDSFHVVARHHDPNDYMQRVCSFYDRFLKA